MRKAMLCVLVGAAMLGGVLTGGRALALGDVSCDADAAFVSRYVWRGIVLTDDPSLQPGFTAEWRGLSFNFWGNMDLGDANDNEGEFTEADFTVAYGLELGKLELSAGVLHYNFPNVGTEEDDTTEVYATAALDVPGSPSIGVWVDINETDGTYASLGLSHELPLPREMTLALAFNLGIGSPNNNEAYCGGVNETAFTDVALSATVSRDLSESVGVSASVTWTALLDDDVRAASTDDDNVFGAVAVSCSF